MNTKREASVTRYLPSHINNPVALVWRLLREENPAARSALLMTACGMFLLPMDIVLSHFERRRMCNAIDPKLPVILVCGAPRSGTTLVSEYLISKLDAGYLSNLTSLFPRSPLTANALFDRFLSDKPVEYRAFYGKTRHLAGANDALYIWDRWLGSDRSLTPKVLSETKQQDMRRFFGELQSLQMAPTINKVNRLNTCAHLVTKALPTAFVVYVKRDPVMLAQSLYVARRDIVGDMSKPYGVTHTNQDPTNPVEDVCRQVEFYEESANFQYGAIGKSRMLVLEYEHFCRNPMQLLDELVHLVPGLRFKEQQPGTNDEFTISSRKVIDDATFDRIENRLHCSNIVKPSINLNPL